MSFQLQTGGFAEPVVTTVPTGFFIHPLQGFYYRANSSRAPLGNPIVPAAGNYNAIDERGYLISPQQYDLWRTYSYLPSGTYRVYFDVSYGADRGIVELYVDDTLAGSINSYASSGSRYTLPLNSTGARNTIPLLASAFQITVSGVKKIELFVSRKDGASNNFYIVWRGMCFLKTA